MRIGYRVPYRSLHGCDHRAVIRVTAPCVVPPGCPDDAKAWYRTGAGTWGIGRIVPDQYSVDYHMPPTPNPLGSCGRVHPVRDTATLVWVANEGLERTADGWEWWADWVVLREAREVQS